MAARLAAAAVAALVCTATHGAGAPGPGRSVTTQELDTYVPLREARALADARAEAPGGRTQGEADFQRSLLAAGWTAQRYREVDGLVDDVTGYLRHAAERPGQGEAYWKGAERVDAPTIALVKARLPRLVGAAERARRALRDEREVAILGRPATVADLQGTWKRDREASRAHLAAALHYSDAQVKELLKDRGESSFTFSGDRADGLETRAGAAGEATAWTTTYRLEGRDLVFSRRGEEERLQVGVKSPTELIIGSMGVPSGVYRKH